jgi:hypothetical protein
MSGSQSWITKLPPSSYLEPKPYQDIPSDNMHFDDFGIGTTTEIASSSSQDDYHGTGYDIEADLDSNDGLFVISDNAKREFQLAKISQSYKPQRLATIGSQESVGTWYGIHIKRVQDLVVMLVGNKLAFATGSKDAYSIEFSHTFNEPVYDFVPLPKDEQANVNAVTNANLNQNINVTINGNTNSTTQIAFSSEVKGCANATKASDYTTKGPTDIQPKVATLSVDGDAIEYSRAIRHLCCISITLEKNIAGTNISLHENWGGSKCKCECSSEVSSRIENLPAGTYNVNVFARGTTSEDPTKETPIISQQVTIAGEQGAGELRCGTYSDGVYCAHCGNGACEPRENCTSTVPGLADCGGLYCSQDCKATNTNSVSNTNSNNCICTSDERPMCNPTTTERKSVPSGCTCGELNDVTKLRNVGWVECQ